MKADILKTHSFSHFFSYFFRNLINVFIILGVSGELFGLDKAVIEVFGKSELDDLVILGDSDDENIDAFRTMQCRRGQYC